MSNQIEKIKPIFKYFMDFLVLPFAAFGFILIVFGYMGMFLLGKFPSPVDDMSLGLGFIGLSLAFIALRK